MDNHIVCPHCQNKIPLSDALSHQIRDEYRKQAQDYAKKKDAEYKQKLEELAAKAEEEKKLLQKTLEDGARKKIEEEMKRSLDESKTESEELKKRNRELSEQLTELTRTMRQLQTKMEEKDLEVEKKLYEEQDKIRTEAQKKASEEFHLKLLEKEKQLDDTKKALEDARRKSEQVSQQLQGEVLELEVENLLKQEFPFDEISPVAKGVRGGDVLQIVRNNHGKVCGTIIWELKRTKSWSNDWISKLKDDQRNIKAELAVLVTDILPNDLKNFGLKEGVWVTNFENIIGVAYALRQNLLNVAQLKMAEVGKNEKMEVLYNYIYGTEFRQRIEAVVEAFHNMQQEVEREKRFFALKWAREEKNIRKVIDSTFGLRGDLESITGKELGDTERLQLEDGEVSDTVNEQETEPENLQETLL